MTVALHIYTILSRRLSVMKDKISLIMQNYCKWFIFLTFLVILIDNILFLTTEKHICHRNSCICISLYTASQNM